VGVDAVEKAGRERSFGVEASKKIKYKIIKTPKPMLTKISLAVETNVASAGGRQWGRGGDVDGGRRVVHPSAV
jgi:hypothetical protein